MKSKVYYTKNITPENLIKIYEALGINLDGNVGIKVSTGEDGAKGYLKKELIGPLVKKLNGTIIECNTAYNGKRNTAEEHMQVAKKHGFTDIAKVDIMDANGEFKNVNGDKDLLLEKMYFKCSILSSKEIQQTMVWDPIQRSLYTGEKNGLIYKWDLTKANPIDKETLEYTVARENKKRVNYD